MDTNECQWCDNKLTEEEQANYDTHSGNWVAWCGLDKFATCDECMKTMCEVCKGPCEDVCTSCHEVCQSYLCDNMTAECACSDKEELGDSASPQITNISLNQAPFEITLDNLNNYTKKRIQDENVKYNLARCKNETKDKTMNKLASHLEKLSKNASCLLKLDDDQAIEYTYPQGKTRLDLNKVLNDFFSKA